jgi:hypothetical protein
MKEQDVGIKWFNTVFYPEKNTGRAVRYRDGILDRLRQQEIVLFTPWGPRYSFESRGVTIRDSDKEMEVLKFLANFFAELQQNMRGKRFRWMFLGADLYGSRINNLPQDVVSSYFDSLRERLNQVLPVAEFSLWSQFDSLAELYRERVRTDFKDLITPEVMVRAMQTARAMGRNSSAHDYLVERLAEATLIENNFRPIKISCVARHKDHIVDWNLPRLYLVPKHLHAPWL